jgi:hypothetical protein
MGTGVRFFTIADAAYYPGVVALLNSLRIQGHDDPVTVLDLGLTPAQRAELAAHCDFVRAPPEPRHPWLLAPFVCRAHPTEITVYIDCDVVVTAPLHQILDDARAGKVCGFPDRLPDRWFAEWEETFALPGPPRHQTYVNTGFVAFSTRTFPRLLEQWADRCARLSVAPVSAVAVDLARPTALADQDAWNALLMTVVDPAQLAVQPAAATAQGNWQLSRTQILDEGTLACSRDGRPVTLLHCFGVPKPWQADARRYLPRTAYLRCLRRLLTGDDLALRTAERQVPWLSRGLRGRLSVRLWTGREALRVRVAARRGT